MYGPFSNSIRNFPTNIPDQVLHGNENSEDSVAAFIAGTEYANSSFLHIIAFIFAHIKWEKLCT